MKQREVMAGLVCLSANEVLQLALRAYYAAGSGLWEDFKASGEPWLGEDGRPWCGPTQWVAELHRQFTRRLEDRAARLRLPPPDSDTQLLWWQPMTWRQAHGLEPVSSGSDANDLPGASEMGDASGDAGEPQGATA